MTRQMQKTPESMVQGGQITAFGHFDSPFRNINAMEADVFGTGKTGARLFNRFRLKEWQHFAIFGQDLLFTFVVFNAHYISNSFCYFVDRKSGEMIEHHREGLPFAARLADELWDDRCSFKMSGYRIGIRNHLEKNRHFASIDIDRNGATPGISADLELIADLACYQPIVVVLRLAPNRPAYSHKMACPASGRITVGDRTIDLDPGRHIVMIDVHKAYYPYRMNWSWATCAGYDGDGRLIGLNLTHNVIEDDTDNNENGLWVGNELSVFQAARFTFDEDRILEPWRVETEDGRCKIDFKPEGERRGKINFGVISSDYHQPYGTFSGEATDDSGKLHIIRNFFGVTELHKARF